MADDVARLRKRLHAALSKLARKPGAAALRETRILIHALARRQDWGTATDGAVALVAALIHRGHAAEAGRVIHDAGAWVAARRDERAHGELALATAALHLAQGMLADAEANARAALAAAVARGDIQQHVRAVAVLAEALFWLGRHEEAREIVAAVDHGLTDDRLLVPIAVAAAYVAVGSRSPGAAPPAAARAVAASERLDDAAWRARAFAAAAFVQLTLDDRGAASAAAARALAAAHAARDPLLALEARLTAVEVDRREGRLAPAARLLRRMKRWPASRQPAKTAARVALLREAITGHPADIAAERVAARTGLRALPLFVPQPDNATAAALSTDDVLELVGEMHDAGDDRSALTGICSRVRMRLRAAGVAFLVPEPGPSTRVLASDGARLDPGLGGRVLAADCPIHDAPPAGGHESGVPVRYGGRTLGVLIARWRAGVAPVHHRASAVLSIAAIVSAPAVASILREPELPPVPDAIVGVSDSIAAVRQAIERAANAPYPVLIEGESGSGKELVARALHRRSRRRDRPFVAINCAALPDDLLEAELFGHARGAFTGATIDRAGVFEEAHGGTLFLDEVGELSPRAQAKLLRTLQDGEVRRLGENQARRVDVRVVAATNRQLRQEVAGGAFRLDLLYRLDVVRIVVPPLRERLVDLPLLIERYWREATDRVHSRAVLSTATVAALSRHQWPGNVRELQNVLASLAVRAPRRGVVPPTALPWTAKVDGQPQRLNVARRAFEVEFIQSALVRAGGHRGRAASELGVSRQGLTKLITRLAIAGAISEPSADAQLGTVREPASGRESTPDREPTPGRESAPGRGPARGRETIAGCEPALQSGTI